jgi:hypothetical protein
MECTKLSRVVLTLASCSALLLYGTLPALAKCDLPAATSNLLRCRNDISGTDPSPLLTDCSKSVNEYRLCESDKKMVSSLNERARDELSYYLAWALFGKAGAERHLYDEASAIRDFKEVKMRLEEILKDQAMPKGMLFNAQTMLTSVDSALNN